MGKELQMHPEYLTETAHLVPCWGEGRHGHSPGRTVMDETKT